jgi:low temperature requirement protein LtrA
LTASARRSLLRGTSTEARVTNIELFFDLVYVFAVTQLSHQVVAHPDATGLGQSAVLLGMVWLAWVYTSWVTNWLDPQRIEVRGLLVGLMLASLVLSAVIPQAYGHRGLALGVAYAVMQIGRTLFTVWATRGNPLQRNFERVLVWCLFSGGCAVVGGLVHELRARELLWLAAIAIDLVGGAVGFWTPRLGRSATSEWTIQGSHFAERCQAFLLIALGESVVVIGERLTDFPTVTAADVAAFATAFVGCVGLWWIYFDRSAEEAAGIIAASTDPGRLARSAYHFIHPVMVAGVIITAAADEEVLSHPLRPAGTTTSWLVLGGTALFLVGHALFKRLVWRHWPWSRLAAIVALGIIGLAAHGAAAWVLSALSAAVIIAVAVADRVLYPAGEEGTATGSGGAPAGGERRPLPEADPGPDYAA